MNMVSSQIYFILWRENGFGLVVDPEHFWYKWECLPFCTAPNITRKLVPPDLPLQPQTWPEMHTWSTESGLSLTCNNKGRDLNPTVSVRRHTAAEWRWACLRSRLWPQGRDTRINFLVLLGACAIPLSRFGGMSAAYSVSWWLNLIRYYCWCLMKERNCTYHTSYYMRHNSSEKTWLWNAN